MKEYLIEINHNTIIEDYNGVFELNNVKMIADYSNTCSTYIVPLSNKDATLIKLGQYNKYICNIEPCRIFDHPYSFYI